jgi:hypothetical protein
MTFCEKMILGGTAGVMIPTVEHWLANDRPIRVTTDRALREAAGKLGYTITEDRKGRKTLHKEPDHA